METITKTTGPEYQSGRRELDFARLIRIVHGSRYWLIGWTLFVTLLGIAYSLLSAPVFQAQAIISMKEDTRVGDPGRLLSQFGGMGGIVASQFGVNNTNLVKMEIILNGHELAESVIIKNNLMPVLFNNLWDNKLKAWKVNDSSKVPTIRKGIQRLTKKLLWVTVDSKKSIIKLGINAHDSLLAKQIVEYYLEELNHSLREKIIRDADINREFLNNQMNNTSDPILREKIAGMIGVEVEKSMLVSSKAFEILEKPVTPMKRTKPRKPLIVFLSFVFGMASSVFGVFIWKFFAELKNSYVMLTTAQNT